MIYTHCLKFSVILYSGLITKLIFSLYESLKMSILFSIETITVQKYLIIQELFHPGLENKGIKIDTSTDPIVWIGQRQKYFYLRPLQWPFKPLGDQHLINPPPRIWYWGYDWLLNTVSLSTHKDMHREQYGEYANWCKC